MLDYSRCANKKPPSLFSDDLLKSFLLVILHLTKGWTRIMHTDLNSALREATEKAERLGESICVVSGSKNNKKIYRTYPLKGFGLPPGGRLEEVIAPEVEREVPEPPEKISSNGF